MRKITDSPSGHPMSEQVTSHHSCYIFESFFFGVKKLFIQIADHSADMHNKTKNKTMK